MARLGFATAFDREQWSNLRWSILAALIEGNIDIFFIRAPLRPERGFFRNIPVTPTTAAILFGVKEEWIAALEHCGYSSKEVFAGNKRLRKEFKLLHGAKGSAVDVEDLAPPETSGLRRRSRRPP
jgi:hypothetical protein